MRRVPSEVHKPILRSGRQLWGHCLWPQEPDLWFFPWLGQPDERKKHRYAELRQARHRLRSDSVVRAQMRGGGGAQRQHVCLLGPRQLRCRSAKHRDGQVHHGQWPAMRGESLPLLEVNERVTATTDSYIRNVRALLFKAGMGAPS